MYLDPQELEKQLVCPKLWNFQRCSMRIICCSIICVGGIVCLKVKDVQLRVPFKNTFELNLNNIG